MMKNNDYKTEFEEHKKEIKLTDDSSDTTLKSRAEIHSKARKPKKPSRHKYINIFLGLFALIPIVILVFVFSNWASPQEKPEAGEESEGIQIEPNDKIPADEEKVEGISKEEEKKKELEEKEKQEQEELAKKQEQEKLAEEQAKQERERLAQEEAQKREQEELARKQQEEKAAADAKRAAEARAKEEAAKKAAADAKAKEEAAKKPTQKTHIVKNGETLYRISVNYYGHGEGVDKIKQANGLSSNSISTGQKLTIPE